MGEFVRFFALAFGALLPVMNPVGSSLGFSRHGGCGPRRRLSGAREKDCDQHGSIPSGDEFGGRGGSQAVWHLAGGSAAWLAVAQAGGDRVRGQMNSVVRGTIIAPTMRPCCWCSGPSASR
jgi:hypothetical protein